MANFDPLRFAAFLNGAYRNSRFKSHSELAEAAGLKRATVSSLISAKPQTATGKPSQPRPETVAALAQVLNIDADEARLAAGYAPASLKKPTNLKELIEALEFLGLPVPQLHGGFEKLVEDSGGFEEALQRIYLDLTLVLKRHESGGTVRYLELPVTEEEGEKRKWK